MMLQKLKMILLMLTVSAAALTGAGVMARQHAGGPHEDTPEGGTPIALGTDLSKPEQATAKLAVRPAARPKPTPTSAQDLYRELIETARGSYLASAEEVRAGRGSLLRVYLASRQLLDAQRDAAKTLAEKARAVEEHIDRIRTLESRFELGSTDRAEAAAILAEAQLWLAQAKETKKEPLAKPAELAPAPGSKPSKDARSLAVLAKLEETVSMSFPNETPLEDVLKYIKQATQGSNDAGIPIYVDPLGLQEADRTLTSPIQLDLEHVPLRRTLQLLLGQLGLVYFVDDGILCITSQESARTKFDPSMIEHRPFMEKREKAERGELTADEMKELIEIVKLQKELEKLERPESKQEPSAPHETKANPIEPLIKELRELIGLLKAEREKADRKGS